MNNKNFNKGIFYTALGSTYHTSAINTWSTTADFGTSDQPNLMSSTDNNWYITGVQLEIGTTASDFEHVPLDVQLQRCLRYCNVINGVGGGNFGTIAPGYVTASTQGYFTLNPGCFDLQRSNHFIGY